MKVLGNTATLLGSIFLLTLRGTVTSRSSLDQRLQTECFMLSSEGHRTANIKSLMSKDSSTSHTGREGGDCGCMCASTPQEHEKSVAGAMQRNRKKRGELIKGCAIWPLQSWEPSLLRTRQQTVMQRSINISSGIEKDSNLTKEAGGFVPTM